MTVHCTGAGSEALGHFLTHLGRHGERIDLDHSHGADDARLASVTNGAQPRSPAEPGEVVGSSLPKLVSGSGSRVTDATGKKYLDGSGGPAVFCLGHAHPEVNDAIRRQLDLVAHAYRYNFTSEPLEELTEIVGRRAGNDLQQMVFTCGGSEAVEAALKIALHFHWANGQPDRQRFIARRRSWHGNTLGALSVSELSDRQAPYRGVMIPVSHLSPANAFRPPDGCTSSEVAAWCADELEHEIVRLGADTVAAFIFEPVVGAAGGVVPAPDGYAQLVREVCDRHGVLMIADEVMCGAGRTGTWRALEHDGVVPDIMPVAKGLGGGYVPLGATLYHRRVADVLDRLSGGPMTGHTFTGHTLACAAGLAVQRIVERDGLVERVQRDGPGLQDALRAALADVEAVGDIRGRGFFIGVELVADRETNEPFDPALTLHLRIRRQSLDHGLKCYPMGGNVDGVRGDTVIIAPPYNATAEDLAEIVDLFAVSVRAALAEIGAT
ncbi:MAG: aspartate aminotransferase family protein [Ilumatobacteraceae bacterium]|nr:aspartate aminotransferase family protein [Ilumatobacteraceae bacterium]